MPNLWITREYSITHRDPGGGPQQLTSRRQYCCRLFCVCTCEPLSIHNTVLSTVWQYLDTALKQLFGMQDLMPGMAIQPICDNLPHLDFSPVGVRAGGE